MLTREATSARRSGRTDERCRAAHGVWLYRELLLVTQRKTVGESMNTRVDFGDIGDFVRKK